MNPERVLRGPANAGATPAAPVEPKTPGHGPRAIHRHVTRPIVEHLNRLSAHTVLDLGCGSGWFTGALDRCGFEVVGADIDEHALRLARREYPHLRFEQVDATQALDGGLTMRFDAVVAIDVIDHVAMPRRLVEVALEALRPGGLLVVVAPYHGYVKTLALALAGQLHERFDPLLERGRLRAFSRQSLTGLMSGFDLSDVHCETIGRIPPLARAMMIAATTAR
jgi:2-polyprenyl-6-hydroxyphenyl methylase/3-demethylubiquinone-9 3-methyltransferase